MPFLVAVGVLSILILVIARCGAENASQPAQQPPPARPLSGDISREEAIATLINLNGHLCARVVDMQQLQVRPNTFEVTCVEYRGGSGRVRYIVDMNRGEVTPA